MSATTTHNLPYKRFVAQVSTGAPRPKSTYLSLMAENLEALKACPWREASDVSVALVDHDFTKASHFSDAYDAFKMTGAWNATDQTETAFAGMAAYRFKIPTAAASVAISSISLPISRDRFLKGGVHVAAVRSSSATPSTDWSTVTGAGASAYLANTAANIVATQPADGSLTIATPAGTGGYLWIYVTLEDYTDWWDKYSATEARQYAIEGSAMLVGGSAAVTFAGDVTPDELADALPVVADGVLPRLTGEVSGIFATVRRGNGDGVAFEDAPPDATGADGGMGLHALYADLLLGRLESVPTSKVPGSARPGVGFTITRGEMSLPGAAQGAAVAAPAWRLAASVLLVPFVRPGGRFSSLSLAWAVPTPASGIIRAYLAQGRYIEQPESADISAPAFFAGGDPPEGWLRLGVAAASAGSAVFELPAPPPSPQLATLLLAAWLPQADFDPASPYAQGVGAVAYDPFDGTLAGLDTLVVPTITLI